MLAVNNSKNPARDAKSWAKYSKVVEEAGSCCNHGTNRGGSGTAPSNPVYRHPGYPVLDQVPQGGARYHPHAASLSPSLMTVSARCRLPKHGHKLTRLSLASATCKDKDDASIILGGGDSHVNHPGNHPMVILTLS